MTSSPEPGQSDQVARPPEHAAPPTTSWLVRGAVGLALVALAVLGFGSSAGWFSSWSDAAAVLQGTADPNALQTPTPSSLPDVVDSSQTALTTQASGNGSLAQNSPPTAAPNPPPLAALIPEESLEIIAECRRVAQHLQQLFPGVIEAQEMLARLEFQFGDIAQAQRIWEKILEAEPNYVHALRGLGDVCTLNGQLKEAVPFFRRAVLVEPHDLKRQVTLGVALLQAAEVEQAIEVLQAVVARDPTQVGAEAELGKAYAQTGDYAAARQHFEAALQAEARLASPAQVHFGLATALQRLGESEAAQQHQREYLRLRQATNERMEGERRQYDDVQAIGQDAARLYVDMSRVYLAGGQIASAEMLLHRASRMRPNDIDCRQALAFIAVNQNRPHEAVRWLREVATLNPDDFSVVREVARLYVQLDDPENAQRYLQEYLASHPNSAEALGALAEFYMVVTVDAGQAVKFAQASAAALPRPESFSQLASAHELAGNVAEALAALEKAVELAPANPRYTQRLALLRESLSNTNNPDEGK